MVDAIELVQREQHPRREPARARRQGVEHSDLDVRVRGQPGEQFVFTARVEVVHEQSHPHAAHGGVTQFTQELPADVVVLDHVVLRVNRLLRAPRQRHARVERSLAVGQQAKPREVTLAGWCRRSRDASQARVSDIRERMRDRRRRAGRKASASGGEHNHHAGQEQANYRGRVVMSRHGTISSLQHGREGHSACRPVGRREHAHNLAKECLVLACVGHLQHQ